MLYRNTALRFWLLTIACPLIGGSINTQVRATGDTTALHPLSASWHRRSNTIRLDNKVHPQSTRSATNLSPHVRGLLVTAEAGRRRSSTQQTASGVDSGSGKRHSNLTELQGLTHLSKRQAISQIADTAQRTTIDRIVSIPNLLARARARTAQQQKRRQRPGYQTVLAAARARHSGTKR